jgi:hypothetical protein
MRSIFYLENFKERYHFQQLLQGKEDIKMNIKEIGRKVWTRLILAEDGYQ